MPRSSEQTRERILQAAFRLFRRSGFFRSGVEEIAEASGVTKRTLYHHFESKDDLLAAVLASQHERAFASLESYGVDLSGSPHRLVDALFSGLTAWSGKPRWAGSGFTRLAMELADLPGHPARSVASRHKAVLEAHLADLLARAGVDAAAARARELILLVEGAMVMILIHGDKGYAEAAAAAAKHLIGTSLGRSMKYRSRSRAISLAEGK
jgi:AcrR family transcriptional regulator